MLEFIQQWVINIVTLVLFIVIVEMLLPGGKMKKYINLVTGTILIIAIISPLTGLTGKKFDFTASQTRNSNLLEKSQIQKDGRNLEQAQMKQIVELYRKNIIDQIEQNAEEVDGIKSARADVIINEDYQSATFGEIRRAYISITADSSKYKGGTKASDTGGDEGGNAAEQAAAAQGGEMKNAMTPVKKVDAVRIGPSSAEEQAVGKCDPKLKKELEDRINRVFGVSRENLVITQV